MKKYFLGISFLILFYYSDAQKISLLTSKEKISLRGLSVVNDNIIWASGTKGQVVRSIDGGKHFEWLTVKGYELRDFRDIEAFDANTALIMAVDTPAVILKTKDGGKTWSRVFRDDRTGMFLDAMDFDENGNGMVVGDPIDGKLFIATTSNYGDSWLKLKENDNQYTAATGEAFFAASGTNIKIAGNRSNPFICFVTGGTDSRLFVNGSPAGLDIIHGKESEGANSVDVDPAIKKIAIVGGDFSNDTLTKNNIEIFTVDGQRLLKAPVQTPPHGYRSCVAFLTPTVLIACGTSGVDVSMDGGLNWKLISGESFHVCAKAKKGTAVFLAGKNGRIAKVVN
ncbi:MAG: oxidoreductase [Bacteroidetes bacterium]|nr:oxidoreductase [Bacteroidota bacterium]